MLQVSATFASLLWLLVVCTVRLVVLSLKMRKFFSAIYIIIKIFIVNFCCRPRIMETLQCIWTVEMRKKDCKRIACARLAKSFHIHTHTIKLSVSVWDSKLSFYRAHTEYICTLIFWMWISFPLKYITYLLRNIFRIVNAISLVVLRRSVLNPIFL